ncbi:MAG: hypothetical protein RLZZ387_852 [Chloroflexota bacterium]|jgi:hypothetical protein
MAPRQVRYSMVLPGSVEKSGEEQTKGLLQS